MITNRELGVDDYLAICRRHFNIVLIPALLTALAGFAISFAFTPRYTSRSLLQVEAQIVPAGYVKPIVTGHVRDRMMTLEQNVLSRSRLRPVVSRLGLMRKGKSEDDAIDEIRRNLVVTEADPSAMFPGLSPYAKQGPGGIDYVSGFYVSFTADNPHDAQEVCAELTSMLLAENLEVRQQVAQTTTDFLLVQLEQAKHNLDEIDAKLSEFKKKHFGRLPGDAENNLRILTGLSTQLDANTQTLARAQQDKSYAESMLAQELAAWKSTLASPTLPPLRQELIDLQNKLVNLQTRYTDDHPDVVKTKRELAELTSRLKQMNSNPGEDPAGQISGNSLEPLEIRRLRQQVHNQEGVIERATAEQKQLRASIDLYQSRLAVSPEVEEQYKQLTRDNATAHNIYDNLLANQNTAAMHTEMERKQQGEQLRLLDSASAPGSPSFPVRWRFAVYGFGGGLTLGLVAAFWLELRDKSIRDEKDVLAALQLPMLVSVPWVHQVAEHNTPRQNKLRGRFQPLFERERTG